MTWQFTTICNSSSGTVTHSSVAADMGHSHECRKHVYTQKKSFSFFIKQRTRKKLAILSHEAPSSTTHSEVSHLSKGKDRTHKEQLHFCFRMIDLCNELHLMHIETI